MLTQYSIIAGVFVSAVLNNWIDCQQLCCFWIRFQKTWSFHIFSVVS